jgi:hypothetical protein
MATNADTTNPTRIIEDDDHDPISPFEAIPNFCGIARGLMNHSSCRDGGCWSSTETWLFRKFFKTSVRVVETVWELIIRDELRPMGGRLEHLLWAKQGPGCSTIGTSNGAVDPKTHQKWVWAFIEAISKLVDVVVSVFDCCVLFSSNNWPFWQSSSPSMMTMSLLASSPSE